MELVKELRLFNGDRARVVLRLKSALPNGRKTIGLDDVPSRGYVRVSIVGEIAPHGVRYGTNAGSYGQIVDSLPSGALRDVWQRYHLNDMSAACAHMSGGAKLGDRCAVCGYSYGTAWLVDVLAVDEIVSVLRVFGAAPDVVIVTHDGVPVAVMPDGVAAGEYLHRVQPHSWDYALTHGGGGMWRLGASGAGYAIGAN